MKTAIVDIEDSRFYSHDGIDYKGLLRAALDRHQRILSQGGSTITQQYVKNVLLYSADSAQQASSRHRQVDRPQAARGPAGPGAGGALVQEPDPRGLPEHRLLRSGRVRHRRGRRALLRRDRRHSSRCRRRRCSPGWSRARSPYDPITYPKAALKRRGRGAQPHAAARSPDRRAGEGGQGGAARPESGRAAADRRPVPDVDRAVLLRLGTHASCATIRRSVRPKPMRDQRLLEGGLTIKTTLDPAVQAAAQNALNADGRAVQQRHGRRGDRPAGHRQRARDGREQALRHRPR